MATAFLTDYRYRRLIIQILAGKKDIIGINPSTERETISFAKCKQTEYWKRVWPACSLLRRKSCHESGIKVVFDKNYSYRLKGVKIPNSSFSATKNASGHEFIVSKLLVLGQQKAMEENFVWCKGKSDAAAKWHGKRRNYAATFQSKIRCGLFRAVTFLRHGGGAFSPPQFQNWH